MILVLTTALVLPKHSKLYNSRYSTAAGSHIPRHAGIFKVVVSSFRGIQLLNYSAY